MTTNVMYRQWIIWKFAWIPSEKFISHICLLLSVWLCENNLNSLNLWKIEIERNIYFIPNWAEEDYFLCLLCRSSCGQLIHLTLAIGSTSDWVTGRLYFLPSHLQLPSYTLSPRFIAFIVEVKLLLIGTWLLQCPNNPNLIIWMVQI